MERLTEQDEQGNWCLKGIHWNELYPGNEITAHVSDMLCMALAKLKDYEETGLSPEEIESLNDFEKSQISHLMLELEKERKKHKWIPCSEKLPDCYNPCLITVKTDKIRKTSKRRLKEKKIYVEEDTFFRYNYPEIRWDSENDGALTYTDEEVIAWMPLPEPYKEEENE